MSIEDYSGEFDQLMFKDEFEEPNEHSIVRYLSELNYEISNVVNRQPFFSLHDVMKLDLKMEKKIKQKRLLTLDMVPKVKCLEDRILRHHIQHLRQLRNNKQRVKKSSRKHLYPNLNRGLLNVKG